MCVCDFAVTCVCVSSSRHSLHRQPCSVLSTFYSTYLMEAALLWPQTQSCYFCPTLTALYLCLGLPPSLLHFQNTCSLKTQDRANYKIVNLTLTVLFDQIDQSGIDCLCVCVCMDVCVSVRGCVCLCVCVHLQTLQTKQVGW